MQDEYPEAFSKEGIVYDVETLYWIGYLYRYWHFYTVESSKEIFKIANAKKLNILYLRYHTLSLEMAIDLLKEAKQR